MMMRQVLAGMVLLAVAQVAEAAPPWSRCPSIPDPYSVRAGDDLARGRAVGWTRGRAEGLRRQALDAPPGQLARVLRDRARGVASLCRHDRTMCADALLPSAARGRFAAVDDGCTEQTVSLTGTVLAFILEPLAEGAPSELRFGFVADDGEEFALYEGWGDNIPTGRARVTAQRMGNDLYMTPGSAVDVLAGDDAAAFPIPAWAVDLGLAQIKATSLGATTVLHIMAADTNASYPYTAAQTRTQISDVIERSFRDVSWGQHQLTARLHPDVVAFSGSLACSPWSALQQVLPLVDGAHDFRGIQGAAIYHPFEHCGWCGIANRDSSATLETNDGTVVNFGANLTRTTCTTNSRMTHAHEQGHNQGWVHGGTLRPFSGLTFAHFDPLRPLNEEVWTYTNRHDWQGSSAEGGHPSTPYKSIVGWLEGAERFVWPPTARSYELRPVSSPEGTVAIGWPRGVRSGVVLEFRQRGDEWESHGSSTKWGTWDQCVYLVDTGTDSYLFSNIRLKSSTDTGCIRAGEVIDDPATGARVRVDGFTIDAASPNRSRARVTFLAAPTRKDTAQPVGTITFPLSKATVQGVIQLAATITDADGNAIGGEFSVMNASTGSYAALPNKGIVAFPAPTGSGTITVSLDTRTLADGVYYVFLRPADSIAKKVQASGWTFTIANAGSTTTTTSSSTTTTTRPPTTTVPPTTTTTSSSTTTTTVVRPVARIFGPTTLGEGQRGTWRLRVDLGQGWEIPALGCWWQVEAFGDAAADPGTASATMACDQTSSMAVGRNWLNGWVLLDATTWLPAENSPLTVLVAPAPTTTTIATTTSTTATSTTAPPTTVPSTTVPSTTSSSATSTSATSTSMTTTTVRRIQLPAPRPGDVWEWTE